MNPWIYALTVAALVVTLLALSRRQQRKLESTQAAAGNGEGGWLVQVLNPEGAWRACVLTSHDAIGAVPVLALFITSKQAFDYMTFRVTQNRAESRANRRRFRVISTRLAVA